MDVRYIVCIDYATRMYPKRRFTHWRISKNLPKETKLLKIIKYKKIDFDKIEWTK